MRKVYALIVFFIAIILFTILKPTPTSFATYSSPIELLLTKATYMPNELVEGNIILTFTDEIDTASELVLDLEEQTSSLQITEVLDDLEYDYSVTDSDTINKIEEQDIVDQEIEVPLSLFNLKIPMISEETETMDITVTLDSSTDTQPVKINRYGVPAEQSIDRAKTILNNFAQASPDTLLVLDTLDISIEEELIKLDGYETRLANIDSYDLSEEGKSQLKAQINTELKTYLDTLPAYILIKGKVKQQHSPSLEDLTDNILDEQYQNDVMKAELYNLQTKANVQSTSIAFWVTDYSGNQEERTLISKTILNPAGNVYIIEKIPKTIAPSMDYITISGDYVIVEPDPIIKFRASQTVEIIEYMIPGNVVNDVKDTSTLIIPVDFEIIPSIEFACGDGVCTEMVEDATTCPQDCSKKMPWTFIIVILVLIVIGVWYFNFYRGKWSLQQLLEKRKKEKIEKPITKVKKKPFWKKIIKKKPGIRKLPFTTEADHTNLRNYVAKSLEKNIQKPQINKLLLEQGWTQAQIDYIYRELGK